MVVVEEEEEEEVALLVVAVLLQQSNVALTIVRRALRGWRLQRCEREETSHI